MQNNLAYIISSKPDFNFRMNDSNVPNEKYMLFYQCKKCGKIYYEMSWELSKGKIRYDGSASIEYIKYLSEQAGPGVLEKIIIEEDKEYELEWKKMESAN